MILPLEIGRTSFLTARHSTANRTPISMAYLGFLRNTARCVIFQNQCQSLATPLNLVTLHNLSSHNGI